MNEWQLAQEQEKNWWGNCVNTYGEEVKQITYALRMGLGFKEYNASPFWLDFQGTVLDIGGGPVSMLLKVPNVRGTVVDPCDYPEWVEGRYVAAGINCARMPAEELDAIKSKYDEVWIYNCLQHVKDPEKIIANAKKIAPIIRMFEWIDSETNSMHPHSLTEAKLNDWLGAKGIVEDINENGCVGKAFYGVFKV